MKKLLIITLLVFITSFIKGQTVYLTLSPVDMGVGMRYDRHISDFGVYVSGIYGNYHLYHGYIRDHWKISSGLTLTLPERGYDTYFSIGICAHKYGDTFLPLEYNLRRVLSPLSFEVGAGAVMGRIVAGFRIDPYKWDSAIDIGFKF